MSGGAARVTARTGGSDDAVMQALTEITSSIKDLAGSQSSGMDPMMMMMMMMMMGGGGGGGAAAAAAPRRLCRHDQHLDRRQAPLLERRERDHADAVKRVAVADVAVGDHESRRVDIEPSRP